MIELLLALAIDPGLVWAGYRGEGDGLSGAKNLPVEWGTNRNVAWKADLAGYGQSSPVVWRDSAYVTSVDGPNKEQVILQAISLSNGRVKWQETSASSFPEKSHDRISKAAPTPAVDSDRVYAFFESGDLFAFTHQGKQVWHRAFAKDYGPFKTNHGLGSSLRLAHGTLFVFLAHMGPSALIAVDPATGKDRWTAKLAPAPSFTTPFGATQDGRALILISAGGGLTALDARSGEQLWTRKGKGGRGYGVPSPTVANGVVVVPSSEKGGTHAVRLAKPDEIVWTAENATTEFSAALVHQGRVYLVNGVGALFCLDLATGKELFTARLPGSHWASAIGAGDRVYFFGVEGKSTVLKAADTFERIAENELVIEGRLYGIAPVNGAILLRTGKQLWKVGR